MITLSLWRRALFLLSFASMLMFARPIKAGVAVDQFVDQFAVPKFEDVEKIDLSMSSSWSLQIRADGSGKLGYGSVDEALLPEGSFEMRNMFKRVTRHLRDVATQRVSVYVIVTTKGNPKGKRYEYVGDPDGIAPIFEIAKTRLASADRIVFNRFFAWYPFLPALPR